MASIIIPTYYRNELLDGAIESARRQTYDPVEIIVVDDSGEAHAEGIVDEYDVQYIPLNENRGVQAARKIGLDHSSGEYIDFLDDDDRFHPEKLRSQVPLIGSDVGVVYSGIEWETDANGREVFYPNPEVRGDVLRDALAMDMFPCCDPTMLISRRLLEDVPLLRHNHSAVDIGMMIELAQRTEFDYVDRSLVTAVSNENTLTDSVAYTDNRLYVIDLYDHLYDDYPIEVKRSALARTYHWRGEKVLERELWSIEAIRSFLYAAYYSPENSPEEWLRVLASFFGRPGIAAGTRIL